MKVVMRDDLAEQGLHIPCHVPGKSKKRLLSAVDLNGAKFIKFSPGGITIRLVEEDEMVEVSSEEVDLVRR
jgi:hypothetical protein